MQLHKILPALILVELGVILALLFKAFFFPGSEQLAGFTEINYIIVLFVPLLLVTLLFWAVQRLALSHTVTKHKHKTLLRIVGFLLAAWICFQAFLWVIT